MRGCRELTNLLLYCCFHYFSEYVPSSQQTYRDSSLDRALEQRHDDLALKQHKDDEGGYQNQDRAGT